MNQKCRKYLVQKRAEVDNCPKCKGMDLQCSCYKNYIWAAKKVGADIPYEFLDWVSQW